MTTPTATRQVANHEMTNTWQIRVYNTLTRQKEPFQTVQPGRVGMYLCGPTVYKEAHIGHMVGPVIFDCIKRYLTYCGYAVTWVVNITDVDDKLIAESQRRQLPMSDVAEEMTADYLRNLQALGVNQIDALPRATEYIPEIQRLIQCLIDRGFAYASEGDVYFEVARDPDYGKLSNRSADSQQGEGGEAASRKRSPGDFALWKRSKPREPAWDSPWGGGRPGWHIECSAMSHALLGESFDIHGGGLDLVFPHHENEMAQSESCHGQPMARYWMHNGLMRASAAAGKVGGRGDRQGPADVPAEAAAPEAAAATIDTKISRSKGAGGLAELIAHRGGPCLRFFLLRTHYRSTIVFDEAGLDEAAAALETFYRYFERFARITGSSFYELVAPQQRGAGERVAAHHPLVAGALERRAAFLAKMDDDFNSGAAISELFELVRALNKFADGQRLEDAAQRAASDLQAWQAATVVLRELTQMLGLFLQPPPAESHGGLEDQLMQILLGIRAAARENRDFATADRVRDELKAIGIVLEDRPDGTGWRREG